MSQNTLDVKKQNINARNAALDNIRGLFILLFIAWHMLFNLLRGLSLFPNFFRHAYIENILSIPWWGFNLIDLAPITFMLFMGLIIYPNFSGKYERVGKRAFRDHLIKNLALNGLFLMFIIIADRFRGTNEGWSFMNDVATTGIIMTPFLSRPFRESTIAKFVAGAALLVVYWLFRAQLLQYLGTGHPGTGGGIGACVGFTGIVLVSAGMSDLARKKTVYFLAGVAVLYLIGLLCTRVFMPAETYGEEWWKVPMFLADERYEEWLPFAMFSVFWMVGALSKAFIIYTGLWAVCHYLLKDKRVWGLSTIGRNLMLYIFIALIAIVIISFLGSAVLWRSLLYVAIVIVLCFIITIPLEKYKVTFKL